ncbi:tudor domain-containing protein 7-like [Hylaeus anthracinus]|uniref:tudor domain-containing protein 7-like n=1 Tax=Hylaeus anthracinus TaxID=313031 RepID=UPI0023B9C914|nr:tudor domain-containing protein 7-like [Hylaeus anthracinus]
MDRDEVIKNLRACLISSKGGVKIQNLCKDYQLLIDESIPFRKLGFSSLVAFLRTVPGIKTIDKGSECYVEAVPTEESAHISKLIARQKTVSKKPSRKLMYGRRPTPQRQPMIRKPIPITKSVNDNRYSHIYGRQNSCVPAMSVPPTKITFYQNNEKPRFIQTDFGNPPSSPSKRLNDKQRNPVLQTNQSFNKPINDSCLKKTEKVVAPVISQKPKTINNNVEILPKEKPSSISERLKVKYAIPALLSLQTNPPPLYSEVLSPLSPGQVCGNDSHLQLPRNTSTPLSTPLRTVPKIQPNDPRDELRRKAIMLKFPEPVYQICPAAINNTKKAVFAQVKISSHLSFSSYPEEAYTEDDAQKIAARIALIELDKMLPSSKLDQTTNSEIIKGRIMNIVDAHPNGIFMHRMPVYYTEQYKEILPINWEKIIEEYPAIVLEKGVDNSVILRRFVSSPEKIRNITPPKADKILLNSIGPAEPGKLELPKDDFWCVYITSVVSTTEVWGRLVGELYSDQLELMETEMAQYYNGVRPIKQSLIEVGNYYVVFQGESWHRVHCIDYNISTGNATVLFIDYGAEDTIHYSKLLPLDKRFCVLPAQALRFCLAGLEDFSECDSILPQIEKFLLDHVLYAEVVEHEKNENEPCFTVVFYDANGPEDININIELSKQILHTVAVPKLDNGKRIHEVFISHVEPNGDVFVQVQSKSMKILVCLLNRLICTGLNTEELKKCSVTTIDFNKTYFVSENNNWYRGKIVSNSRNQLRAYLIDFGKTVTTSLSNLLSLETLSDVLAKYPAQALKVHLHNIDKSMFDEKMVTKLREIAPDDEPLLIKVVSFENDLPVVELFNRIQQDDSKILGSINNTLDFYFREMQGDGNNNIKEKKRTERSNSKYAGNEVNESVKSLKPPKISGIGEYFDVHVTMAAHPGNFTVQPFDDQIALEKMMIHLQETCHLYEGAAPTTESIREGKLYAAKHIDGHWYRVCISSIIKENMVSVYFCDFGDVSVLPLSKLQPLKSQFLELPYQAIKARLAGIQPINVDWSVEDSLRFQELVVDKNFVSVVVESNSDGLSPADTILGLKLIDVNTTEDIYIDKLLVNEGRATSVN